MCPKILCWLRDVKKVIRYILKVSTRLCRCKSAEMQVCNRWTLIWVDTDKSVDPTRKKIRSRLCAREYKTKKQGTIQRALPASQLFSAMPLLEAVSVLLNHDVGEFVEQRETIEVETLRHQQSTFPKKSPEPYLHQTTRRGSSEVWRRQKLAG